MRVWACEGVGVCSTTVTTTTQTRDCCTVQSRVFPNKACMQVSALLVKVAATYAHKSA